MNRRVFGYALLLSSIAAVFYFFFANQSLEQKLSDFRQLPAGPEKTTLALELIKSHFTNESADILKLAEQLREPVTYLTAVAQTFEKQMQPEHLSRMIADLPGARADVTGVSLDVSRSCPINQFRSIVEEQGLEFVVRYGFDLSILAGMYEDRMRPLYFDYIKNYAKLPECADPMCPAMPAVYEYYGQQARKVLEKIEKKIVEIQDRIRQLAPTEAEAFQLVDRLARKWPDCLGQLNMSFVNRIQDEFTRFRGEFLLAEYLRLGVQSNEDLQSARPQLEVASFLKSSTDDAWGTQFAAEIIDGNLMVVSAGADMSTGTDDDVKFVKQISSLKQD